MTSYRDAVHGAAFAAIDHLSTCGIYDPDEMVEELDDLMVEDTLAIGVPTDEYLAAAISYAIAADYEPTPWREMMLQLEMLGCIVISGAARAGVRRLLRRFSGLQIELSWQTGWLASTVINTTRDVLPHGWEVYERHDFSYAARRTDAAGPDCDWVLITVVTDDDDDPDEDTCTLAMIDELPGYVGRAEVTDVKEVPESTDLIAECAGLQDETGLAWVWVPLGCELGDEIEINDRGEAV